MRKMNTRSLAEVVMMAANLSLVAPRVECTAIERAKRCTRGRVQPCYALLHDAHCINRFIDVTNVILRRGRAHSL